MGLDHVRSEIEHMRVQVGRQRKEILQLQSAGISTARLNFSSERMQAKIDDLCVERERLKRERAARRKGACLAAGAGDGLNGTTRTRTTRPGSRRLLNCVSALRARATAISTSRRSRSRSINTQRRRSATAITFSTSLTASADTASRPPLASKDDLRFCPVELPAESETSNQENIWRAKYNPQPVGNGSSAQQIGINGCK